MAAICLDCADRSASETARACPACRSPRLRRHAELESLSIAHIDCDAFYATIEKRDNPDLADKPLIIGGGRRGVVSTACYIARTYGVKSAMPMFKALKACPDAVVLKPDMQKYVDVGRAVKRMMLETTPLVQPLSLDEAFLDLTGTERLHRQPPAATLVKLSKKIERELGITVSIGLAANKFLAKFASERDKPRGFFVVGASDARQVLAPCPPTVIFGVGKQFGATLAADGIVTLQQVQEMDERDMLRRYGDMGVHIWRLSQGLDSRRVDPEVDGRGMSAETTFNEDIADIQELDRILWSMCERVSARAKAAEQGGSTIVLKLRTSDFKILTRRTTLYGPTQLAEAIYQAAHRLLTATADGKARYRLIGVGIANLADAERCDLFDLFKADEKKSADAERAIDKVRSKFGKDAIVKGRAL
ncbi:MAG: DNA polymerase IV [Alphaproteobacteria bacterium]|nr:DNA polymerase IV [Alphaproteobacteria bacterium]